MTDLGQPITYGQEPESRTNLQDILEGKIITHAMFDPTGWDDLGYVEGWPTAAFELDSAEVLLVSGVPNLTKGATYRYVLPPVLIPAPLYLSKGRALIVQQGRPDMDATDVQTKLRGQLIRRACVVRAATREGGEQMLWEFSDGWRMWLRAGQDATYAMAGSLEVELVDPERHISLPASLTQPIVSRVANTRSDVDLFARLFGQTKPAPLVEP